MSKKATNLVLSKALELQPEIEHLLSAAKEAHHREGFNTPTRNALTGRLVGMQRMLEQAVREIDPAQLPESFFNPTEPSLIGRFISIALVGQKRPPLVSLTSFYGSGVYAIYYKGHFSPYIPISSSETPIYVGKADPKGTPKSPVDQGTKLFDRLREHRKSIEGVKFIDINDFECRYLAVQSGYQAAVERHLINLFRPLWNNETNLLYGIGKHGDSSKTRANNKSPWDILHPGRKWAFSNPEAITRENIFNQVSKHFETAAVFKSVDSVLEAFLSELRRTDDLNLPSTSES